VLDFPKVTGKPGRPKERPDELYSDRGYDSAATKWLLAWLGIEPHFARRNTPHGIGLGKDRFLAVVASGVNTARRGQLMVAPPLRAGWKAKKLSSSANVRPSNSRTCAGPR
jgi:hypothetical protein